MTDITLVSGATTITLPKEMEWVDRFTRNLVAQNVEITAGGSQVIEEFQQQGGFPITLVARGANDTWVTRDVIAALQTLADTPLAEPMELTYNDGTVVLCRFRYNGNTPAVNAIPVTVQSGHFQIFPEDDDSPYALTLSLFQASE